MDPRSEARGPLSPAPTFCETSARPFSDPGRPMDDLLNEVFFVVFNRRRSAGRPSTEGGSN